MEKKNNTGGAGSGFLLGLLIGILVTLLVSTKKGREIFKEFMDKTIQKISDLEQSDAVEKPKELLESVFKEGKKIEQKIEQKINNKDDDDQQESKSNPKPKSQKKDL